MVAEDEQQFLSRQQQYLAQGLPPSQGQGGAMPPGVQKTPDRKVVGSPGVQGSPKKVIIKSKLLSSTVMEFVLFRLSLNSNLVGRTILFFVKFSHYIFVNVSP